MTYAHIVVCVTLTQLCSVLYNGVIKFRQRTIHQIGFDSLICPNKIKVFVQLLSNKQWSKELNHAISNNKYQDWTHNTQPKLN